jgi:hypothetical protein
MKNSESPFYFHYSTGLGHCTFAVLTLMAFVFFKERTLILDASLQSFIILRDNDFAIQVNRFGAAMTQIFPLMALRLGGSLQTILMAYSLGFVLVHWLMFWLCDSLLKQKEMAFGIVLFNIFMVNNTFYWAQNEVIQAISWGFVFWSLLLRRGSLAAFRWFDYPLVIGLLITLVFFHPLFLFPFSFIAIYFLIDYFNLKPIKNTSNLELKSPIPPLSISLILIVFLGFLIIYFLKNKLMPNYYDPTATERLFLDKKDLINFLLNIKNAPSFKDFKIHLFTDFALLPFVLVMISVFYLIKRHYLKLLLVWFSVVFYTLMILISYREGGSWFHIESQYLPMSIFVIMPLIWELIPALINANSFINSKSLSKFNSKLLIFNLKKDPSVFLINKGFIIGIIMSLIILFRLISIYKTHDFYTKRVNYIGELLQKTKRFEGTKFVIEERNMDKTPLIQTWGFAYESLYYSALQSPDSTRSITILVEKEAISKALLAKNSFQGIFTQTPYGQLNSRIFHPTDTINGYKLLEEKDLK